MLSLMSTCIKKWSCQATIWEKLNKHLLGINTPRLLITLKQVPQALIQGFTVPVVKSLTLYKQTALELNYPLSGYNINLLLLLLSFAWSREYEMLEVGNISLLLHIMCGYQCDKAMTKNGTREVIWYHITSWFELSNQIDCNNLVGPIRLHVIF